MGIWFFSVNTFITDIHGCIINYFDLFIYFIILLSKKAPIRKSYCFINIILCA